MLADNSKYADLFELIYGFRPKKAGHSYELLVAAAIKAVMPALKVKANQQVRGQFSKEYYQLDALIESLQKIAIEAKDYSVDDKKVGRPDISKLAGSLNDLPLDGGIVASPTDFTRHAKKYAAGTKLNPNAKPIDLFHIRQTTDEDEQGRIRSINVQLFLESPDYRNAKWEPVFTEDGLKILKALFPVGTQIKDSIEAFYREDGSEIITIFELTRNLSGSKAVNGVVIGEWIGNEQAHIKLKGHLVPIHSYKYEFQFVLSESQIVIEPNGNAVLLVKSEDGTFDKLVTDADLSELKFNDDGQLE